MDHQHSLSSMVGFATVGRRDVPFLDAMARVVMVKMPTFSAQVSYQTSMFGFDQVHKLWWFCLNLSTKTQRHELCCLKPDDDGVSLSPAIPMSGFR